MRPKFVLLGLDKSFCSKCGSSVSLLCDREAQRGIPNFFICFGCKTVSQVGFGEVPNSWEEVREKSTEPSKTEGLVKT
jgi:hypothetical protein